MLKIFSAMDLGPKDVFLDLGCGHGISCLIARLVFNCTAAYGLDIDSTSIHGAVALARKYNCEITYRRCDLLALEDVKELREVTAVYTYDAAFLPEDAKLIGRRILGRLGSLRVLASNKMTLSVTADVTSEKKILVFPEGQQIHGNIQNIYRLSGHVVFLFNMGEGENGCMNSFICAYIYVSYVHEYIFYGADTQINISIKTKIPCFIFRDKSLLIYQQNLFI
jgi:SAM-dependent methyltransferase